MLTLLAGLVHAPVPVGGHRSEPTRASDVRSAACLQAACPCGHHVVSPRLVQAPERLRVARRTHGGPRPRIQCGSDGAGLTTWPFCSDSREESEAVGSAAALLISVSCVGCCVRLHLAQTVPMTCLLVMDFHTQHVENDWHRPPIAVLLTRALLSPRSSWSQRQRARRALPPP